jgi:hypothetical protein
MREKEQMCILKTYNSILLTYIRAKYGFIRECEINTSLQWFGVWLYSTIHAHHDKANMEIVDDASGAAKLCMVDPLFLFLTCTCMGHLEELSSHPCTKIIGGFPVL